MVRIPKVISLLAAFALAIGAVFVVAAGASPSPSPGLSNVPAANTRSAGYSPASILSPELSQTVVAQGSTRLENPSALTSYYGYDNDVLNSAGQPQMVPIPSNLATEAKKTEPDKNTYPADDDRRLHLGSVGQAPAVHHRERRRPDLRRDARFPLDGDRRLRRSGSRRL